jgi:hypothetical protein
MMSLHVFALDFTVDDLRYVSSLGVRLFVAPPSPPPPEGPPPPREGLGAKPTNPQLGAAIHHTPFANRRTPQLLVIAPYRMYISRGVHLIGVHPHRHASHRRASS